MTSGIPFSDDEQAYIDESLGRLSYGEIARELSARFPGHNQGHRSRRGVIGYVKKKRAWAVVQVHIPRPLARQAELAGMDITAFLIESLESRLRA
ncbi:MAG TPA: hypothetical protein HA263_08045 [Methanoregulaceae archaeon]|nr:hypothetical protein [Methanoregulaceae archaeon]